MVATAVLLNDKNQTVKAYCCEFTTLFYCAQLRVFIGCLVMGLNCRSGCFVWMYEFSSNLTSLIPPN